MCSKMPRKKEEKKWKPVEFYSCFGNYFCMSRQEEKLLYRMNWKTSKALYTLMINICNWVTSQIISDKSWTFEQNEKVEVNWLPLCRQPHSH
jgi:hypothetical protein